MSDFRAAEASRLLAATPLQFAASDKDIETLRVTVAASEHAYEEIAQDPSEAKLYDEFVKQWAAYQRVAVRVIDLAQTGRTADAVNLYNTDSRRAFDQSSDILARLTEQTVVKAREDSDRAASTYRHASDAGHSHAVGGDPAVRRDHVHHARNPGSLVEAGRMHAQIGR